MGEYAELELERLEMHFWDRPSERYQRIVPADAITRLLRKRAHEFFDRLWRGALMTRGGAYRWLAHKLGVPEPEAHMGQMTDHNMLKRVVELCNMKVGSTAAQDDFPEDLED